MHSVKYVADPFTGENNSVEIVLEESSNRKFIASYNSNNRFYQAIQEWVAEGNTIADAD